jgi:hypothetical protein
VTKKQNFLYVLIHPGSLSQLKQLLPHADHRRFPCGCAIVRVDALETILRKKKAATDTEIQQEMAAALLRHPLSESRDNSVVLKALMDGAPATLSGQGSSV